MQSEIVELVVGKSRFSVHAALMSSFPSNIVDSIGNEDIDEVVFSRCCEFVYRGDYSLPLATRIITLRSAGQSSDADASTPLPSGRWNPGNMSKNLFHPRTLLNTLNSLAELLDRVPENEAEEELSKDPSADYEHILIGHAEVYRLAIITDWASLRHLSVYRLLRVLANFSLSEGRSGTIVKLLTFAFVDNDYLGNIEDILKHYVIWNLNVLMQDAGFLRLLDRVPSLEKTIFRSMWD